MTLTLLSTQSNAQRRSVALPGRIGKRRTYRSWIMHWKLWWMDCHRTVWHRLYLYLLVNLSRSNSSMEPTATRHDMVPTVDHAPLFLLYHSTDSISTLSTWQGSARQAWIASFIRKPRTIRKSNGVRDYWHKTCSSFMLPHHIWALKENGYAVPHACGKQV